MLLFMLCVTCESRVICHFSSSEYRGNKAKTDKFYMFMLVTGFFDKHNKRINDKAREVFVCLCNFESRANLCWPR